MKDHPSLQKILGGTSLLVMLLSALPAMGMGGDSLTAARRAYVRAQTALADAESARVREERAHASALQDVRDAEAYREENLGNYPNSTLTSEQRQMRDRSIEERLKGSQERRSLTTQAQEAASAAYHARLGERNSAQLDLADAEALEAARHLPVEDPNFLPEPIEEEDILAGLWDEELGWPTGPRRSTSSCQSGKCAARGRL